MVWGFRVLEFWVRGLRFWGLGVGGSLRLRASGFGFRVSGV